MNAATNARALVADVGGTHCRMALARRGADGRSIALDSLRIVPTPGAGFEDAARAYLDDVGCAGPDAIGVAAAGRLHREGGREWIALTNTPLVLDRQSLERLCAGRAYLANDLAAVASALPHLGAADRAAFGPGIPSPAGGRRLVLGVGTGLGASLLTERGDAIDTEAGHADLASVSADERAWCTALAQQGRVSIERVLCGSGLLRLHAVIGGEPPLATVDELLKRWHRGETGARTTLTAFSTWLGRVAGNLVLSLGAWGGVWLIGGVVAGLGEALDPVSFHRGFRDKAPFDRDLAAVPVQRVTHDQPALLGMAALALGGD
jgi:glucokinase